MRFDYSLVFGKAREYNNKQQTRFVSEHMHHRPIPVWIFVSEAM
jgi:hypothetical protein